MQSIMKTSDDANSESTSTNAAFL